MPLACFDAICNVSTHWKHAEGMSLRDDESQIRDSHPLRFMVCFFGGNVDGGGWQNDMESVKKCEIG